MNDDLTILASVYLDGDVTADERAQVEASAELLAEVDRLRTVRAVVSTTSSSDAAPISMRERHLAAALDAWDRLPDNERTGALRDSTPDRRRRRRRCGRRRDVVTGPALDEATVGAIAGRGSARLQPGWSSSSPVDCVLRNTVSDDSSDDAEVSTRPAERRGRADTDGGRRRRRPCAVADAATESELERGDGRTGARRHRSARERIRRRHRPRWPRRPRPTTAPSTS